MKQRSHSNSTSHYIYGSRAVIETIEAGKEIDKLLIQKGLKNELITQLINLAHQRKIPYSKVPLEKLNKITRKNHQGVVGFLSAIEFQSLDHIIQQCYQQGKDPLVLILDQITDVRNFGAIARTAECAGVDALVIPGKGSAQINSDAVKTSAGALNFIPVCREANLLQTLQYLKDNGLSIVAATEKAKKIIYEADFNKPLGILLGSEENGVSPELLKLADEQISIPLQGKIASLNVSVAAGLVTYEILRQKNNYSK
ncbi:MAG: 23S rRNA (guanosine(2251)-2'-O)-methyltransferase RlmB [Candidatus Cyclobacteriaceae bacterium M3_2C_046]